MGIHTGEAGQSGGSSSVSASTARRGSRRPRHGGQILVSRTRPARCRRRPARRRHAARPRGAPAQGPPRARAALPGRGRRPAVRLPAAADARRPPEQPADPADDVRRPRRASSTRPPALLADDPPADADRPGRDRQDAAVAPARARRVAERLSRRRLLRAARARSATRCSSRRASPPRSASPRCGGRPIAESLDEWLREPARPAGPRQLRAGRRRPRRSSPTCCAPRRSLKVVATSRAALHVSGEQEYPVPGLPDAARPEPAPAASG